MATPSDNTRANSDQHGRPQQSQSQQPQQQETNPLADLMSALPFLAQSVMTPEVMTSMGQMMTSNPQMLQMAASMAGQMFAAQAPAPASTASITSATEGKRVAAAAASAPTAPAPQTATSANTTTHPTSSSSSVDTKARTAAPSTSAVLQEMASNVVGSVTPGERRLLQRLSGLGLPPHWIEWLAPHGHLMGWNESTWSMIAQVVRTLFKSRLQPQQPSCDQKCSASTASVGASSTTTSVPAAWQPVFDDLLRVSSCGVPQLQWLRVVWNALEAAWHWITGLFGGRSRRRRHPKCNAQLGMDDSNRCPAAATVRSHPMHMMHTMMHRSPYYQHHHNRHHRNRDRGTLQELNDSDDLYATVEEADAKTTTTMINPMNVVVHWWLEPGEENIQSEGLAISSGCTVREFKQQLEGESNLLQDLLQDQRDEVLQNVMGGSTDGGANRRTTPGVTPASPVKTKRVGPKHAGPKKRKQAEDSPRQSPRQNERDENSCGFGTTCSTAPSAPAATVPVQFVPTANVRILRRPTWNWRDYQIFAAWNPRFALCDTYVLPTGALMNRSHEPQNPEFFILRRRASTREFDMEYHMNTRHLPAHQRPPRVVAQPAPLPPPHSMRSGHAGAGGGGGGSGATGRGASSLPRPTTVVTPLPSAAVQRQVAPMARDAGERLHSMPTQPHFHVQPPHAMHPLIVPLNGAMMSRMGPSPIVNFLAAANASHHHSMAQQQQQPPQQQQQQPQARYHVHPHPHVRLHAHPGHANAPHPHFHAFISAPEPASGPVTRTLSPPPAGLMSVSADATTGASSPSNVTVEDGSVSDVD